MDTGVEDFRRQEAVDGRKLEEKQAAAAEQIKAFTSKTELDQVLGCIWLFILRVRNQGRGSHFSGYLSTVFPPLLPPAPGSNKQL